MIAQTKRQETEVSWSNEEIKKVWEKANVIAGYEPGEWRRDNYGKEIKWEDFGNKLSNYGWGIAHTNLTSNSFDNSNKNLQPLHWNNIIK